ncbi:hypothetical protein O1L44_22655 [Streptomyces noursei]|nr:hypothetical protein [Streptomyces noursei]
MDQPPVPHRQRLTVDAARAVTTDGTAHRLTAPRGLAWTGRITDWSASAGTPAAPGRPRRGARRRAAGADLRQRRPPGRVDRRGHHGADHRRAPARPPLAAVATDAFLRAGGSGSARSSTSPSTGRR